MSTLEQDYQKALAATGPKKLQKSHIYNFSSAAIAIAMRVYGRTRGNGIDQGMKGSWAFKKAMEAKYGRKINLGEGAPKRITRDYGGSVPLTYYPDGTLQIDEDHRTMKFYDKWMRGEV